MNQQEQEISLNKYSVHGADNRRSEEEPTDAADWTAICYLHTLCWQQHHNAINYDDTHRHYSISPCLHVEWVCLIVNFESSRILSVTSSPVQKSAC